MHEVSLTYLEATVLEWLLVGDKPVLVALRNQLSIANIRSRKLTGVGFYLMFDIPPNTPKIDEIPDIKTNFCFGDVAASLDSLKHGIGFLLWVKNGLLDYLEGYTYDEPWPSEIKDFELHYYQENDSRDWDYLYHQCSKADSSNT